MTKKEFISLVSEKAGLTKKDTEVALEATLETITELLKNGDDINFIGFGSFSTAKRAARDGVNPSTGEKIRIAQSTTVKFKAGAQLKREINS